METTPPITSEAEDPTQRPDALSIKNQLATYLQAGQDSPESRENAERRAQEMLGLYIRCDEIAFALQDNPSAVRDTDAIYFALARSVYGDNFDDPDKTKKASAEFPTLYRKQQETLGRLRQAAKTFAQDLSPSNIREDGVNETPLFAAAMRALYPKYNGRTQDEAIQRVGNYAQSYIGAIGGTESINLENMKYGPLHWPGRVKVS